MSTVNTTNVKNAASSTNNLVLGSTGDTQVQSLNTGQLAGLRNQIINGSLDIWQRGTSFSSSGADGRTFFADRWSHRGTNGSGGTTDITQVTYKFGYAARATLAGHTSNFYMETQLEAGDVRELAGKQVTFSCFMTTAAPGFYAETYDSSDAATVITSSVAAMASLGNNMYSYTFMVPDIVIGSSATVAGLTLRVYTNGGNTSSNGGYDFGQAQLEPGPVATPFEMRPIGLELSLCQRYYYQMANKDFTVSTNLAGAQAPGYRFVTIHPTSMRTTPTVIPTGSAPLDRAAAAIGISSATDAYAINWTGNIAAGSGIADWPSVSWTADAEL